jgi:hypothetical protein
MHVDAHRAPENRLNVHGNLPSYAWKDENRMGGSPRLRVFLTYRCRLPGKSVRIGRPGCHACSKATVGGALRSHRLMLGTKLKYSFPLRP